MIIDNWIVFQELHRFWYPTKFGKTASLLNLQAKFVLIKVPFRQSHFRSSSQRDDAFILIERLAMGAHVYAISAVAEKSCSVIRQLLEAVTTAVANTIMSSRFNSQIKTKRNDNLD